MEIKNTASPADLIPLLAADVFELAGALRRLGDKIAGSVGQTQARWQILSVVSGGLYTVAQIARRLGYARQSVQRTTDQLAADELTKYVANPDHRTAPLVELTDEGWRVYREITKAARKWHVALARQIDRGKLETARELIQQLCDVVDAKLPG
jgi:DNA-binding MarR family transcriptional regulator